MNWGDICSDAPAILYCFSDSATVVCLKFFDILHDFKTIEFFNGIYACLFY